MYTKFFHVLGADYLSVAVFEIYKNASKCPGGLVLLRGASHRWIVPPLSAFLLDM